jgi:V/A-type H+-transporting ATPase subunit C
VFSYLQQQWDVRNLKAILRGVRAGRPAEAIIAATVPFGEIDQETLKKMAEASGIEDLLPLFEHTRYGALAALLPAYEQEKSLLPLEAKLDALLLEGMWNSITALPELGCLKPGFAARIDALNLKVVFRAKRDHLMLGDVEKYLIAGGDIPRTFYAAMDEVDEVGALVAELDGTVFHKPLMDVVQDYEKSGSVYDLEKVLEETALGIGRQAAIKQPYGVAPVLGYLTLKETEMRNIRAIARAKETGMAPEKIREFVLRV